MTTTEAVIADNTGYAQAVETAVKAAAAYYGGGDSALDDDAYDRLIRVITAWETDHPKRWNGESVGRFRHGAWSRSWMALR